MRRCVKCVLPETFPGVQFDESGVCVYCRSFKGLEALEESKDKYRARFDEMFKARRRGGSHDCLMAYSGGKDSTYTLVVLRERYDASVLALTVDNGFISPAALENMRNVVEKLGVDHIIYKPRFDLLRVLFGHATESDIYTRKTLERASTICTTCMGIVKFIALRMAVESGIPFITYGWSPGQAPVEASIFQNNPSMVRSMQKVLLDPMRAVAGPDVERYFLTEEHFAMTSRFPHNISPLAFFDYDEEAIIRRIGELGWRKPVDTDPNSTNCLLNMFANRVHRDRLHFNPYSFELAKLVREGYLDRDEAIARLEQPENPEMLKMVRKRLGME